MTLFKLLLAVLYVAHVVAMPAAHSDHGSESSIGALLIPRVALIDRQNGPLSIFGGSSSLISRTPQPQEEEIDRTWRLFFSVDEDESVRIGVFGAFEFGENNDENRRLADMAANLMGQFRRDVTEPIRGALRNEFNPVWEANPDDDVGIFGGQMHTVPRVTRTLLTDIVGAFQIFFRDIPHEFHIVNNAHATAQQGSNTKLATKPDSSAAAKIKLGERAVINMDEVCVRAADVRQMCNKDVLNVKIRKIIEAEC